jgi:hypothetical protein
MCLFSLFFYIFKNKTINLSKSSSQMQTALPILNHLPFSNQLVVYSNDSSECHCRWDKHALYVISFGGVAGRNLLFTCFLILFVTSIQVCAGLSSRLQEYKSESAQLEELLIVEVKHHPCPFYGLNLPFFFFFSFFYDLHTMLLKEFCSLATVVSL